MKIANNQKGIGVIKVIALTPLVLILLLAATFGFYEARKAYWDHRVREMCEEDGGVKVFEMVELTADDFERNDGKSGMIQVMPGSTTIPKHEYMYTQEIKLIRKSGPRVFQRTTRVFRKYDEKVLGQSISFRRSGGDFPTIIGHPSGFGCKEYDRSRVDILKAIFHFEGVNK